MVFSHSTAKAPGPLWLLCMVVVVCGTACSNRADQLDRFGEVPGFTLTDQHGEPFDADATLRGEVWIAEFMFTTCQAACPLMNTRMNAIQDELESEGIRIVSFTVDPETDTPEVLNEYAQRYHASGGVWHFLTGMQGELNYLCSEVFKLGFVDGSLEHSSRFVLVDRDMQIRGYYSALQEENLTELTGDARALLGS